MIRQFKLSPSLACYLSVKELPNGHELGVIFMSKEKGCIWGPKDRPISEAPWPVVLTDVIHKHFNTVFAFEHEDWKGPEPSPRAAFMQSIQPWIVYIEVPDEEAIPTPQHELGIPPVLPQPVQQEPES